MGGLTKNVDLLRLGMEHHVRRVMTVIKTLSIVAEAHTLAMQNLSSVETVGMMKTVYLIVVSLDHVRLKHRVARVASIIMTASLICVINQVGLINVMTQMPLRYHLQYNFQLSLPLFLQHLHLHMNGGMN